MFFVDCTNVARDCEREVAQYFLQANQAINAANVSFPDLARKFDEAFRAVEEKIFATDSINEEMFNSDDNEETDKFLNSFTIIT